MRVNKVTFLLNQASPSPWPFAPLVQSSYRVILCDPPLKFSAGPSRNPARHYRTLSIKEIAALPVGSLAHTSGCRIFLWLPMPHLHRMNALLNAWRFRYCSALPWLKTWPREADSLFLMPDCFASGTGYEIRNTAELLIIAKCGRPQKLGNEKFPGHIIAARRQHSRKPDIVRDEIARLYDGPRCELFARSSHPAFDAWGDQAGLFDEVCHG
jgi:N6-adenosine-specific RNA methylase IME4